MESTGKLHTFFDDLHSYAFLLAQECIALTAAAVVIAVFVWTALSLKDMNNRNSLTISSNIKAFCLLSIACYLLMSIDAAIFLNSFIFTALSPTFCQAAYITYFALYNLGNVCMYFVVSFQIQHVFPASINPKLAISFTCINLYRFYCFSIPSVLWAVYLYLSFDYITVVTIHDSSQHKYQYCYAETVHHPFYAQLTLLFITLSYCVFNISIVMTTNFKSVHNTAIILQDMNWQKHRFMTKLSRFLRKITFLCICAVFTTLVLLICSAYILQQGVFFLVIDAMLNTFCVVCFVEVGDKVYLKTGGKLERFCTCLFCLDKHLSRQYAWLQYQQVHRLNQSNRTNGNTNNNQSGDNNNMNGYQPPNFMSDSDTGFLLTQSITVTGNESNTITPLTGFENVSAPQLEEEEEDVSKKEQSLLLLHSTNSAQSTTAKGTVTDIELQTTMSTRK